MVLVASAGNTFGGAVTYPATRPEVIAVTATDMNNVGGGFAALGAEIDIAAPGVEVLTTTMPQGTCGSSGYTGTCSGTSYAAPHVAAAAAILKARFPPWSNVTVTNQLIGGALYLGPPNQYGAGLLQTLEAFPPPLSASINGPNEVPESPIFGCEWTGQASGGSGAGTRTYVWEVDGEQVGTSQILWLGGPESPPFEDDFELELTVTDLTGSDTADLWVEIDNGAECDP
jgi:subtilisin family serine protease